jgi:ABC-2 type transport system ATP-binding protein
MSAQPAIQLHGVRKAFRTVVAVDGASFEVYPGEIFGLIGPNGAGKTTLLRMILDILRPDAGRIEVFGRPLDPREKDRIAYLPEERGLYGRQTVLATLEYFAMLKGRARSYARRRGLELLERADMADVRDRRIEELSKGNQQKIQVLASLVSDPDVIVFDEPFSGLDPLNARLISGLIREAAAQGRAVLLSMHQMMLVESLCERVFMMARGRRVLYGRTTEIVDGHSEPAVLVRTSADLSRCHLAAEHQPRNGVVKVQLRPNVAPRDLLVWLVESGADVQSFELARMPLEDIFVRVVRQVDGAGAAADAPKGQDA